MKLGISPILIADILLAAQGAFPSECCGLIEGVRDKNGFRALALHETKNLAADSTREFLIDPEAQFSLLRSLRGTERDIIGCYHSHPDGEAAPSATDRASANEDGFLWLIVASGKENGLRAFVFKRGNFREVEIASGVAQPE